MELMVPGHMLLEHHPGTWPVCQTTPLRPGRDAPTVDAIPGFQFLLPHGSHFRRPLTGHCASGRSLPRVRPCTLNRILSWGRVPLVSSSFWCSPQESSFWCSPQESSFWRSQNLRICLSDPKYTLGNIVCASNRVVEQAKRPVHPKPPLKCFSCNALPLSV
jgi:hypothetical protein